MTTVIPDVYLQQIRQHMPDLTLEQIDLNQEGLVNDVVIVNRQRVFRFPKQDWAVALLQSETRILALIRRYVDLPVPHFDICTDQMVSYEMLPGDPLLRDDLLRWDGCTQDALAEALGLFLYQLHSIPQDVLAAEEIPPSDTVRTHADWMRLYEDVQQTVMPLLMSDSREWVERHFAALFDDPNFMTCDPVLVNGDLSQYHILCDRRQQRITGIIDFGTAGQGDPAADFACLINSYGESFVRRMGAFYPSIANHIERARFWAGTMELQWLLGGLRSGDADWFAVHIGRARDVMPLGSGW